MASGVETCVRNRNGCMSAPHFTVLSYYDMLETLMDNFEGKASR
jgi:hypothetical protein